MSKFIGVPTQEDYFTMLAKAVDNTAEMAGNVKQVSASFTRPADTTAYASGDLVANSTTAGSVVAMTLSNVARVPAGDFDLKSVVLRKSGTSITNASFLVHFYSTLTITCANGDNGAWSTDAVASYLGFLAITIDKAFTDGAFGFAAPSAGLLRVNLATGRNLYALLSATAAYTPASAEVFTLIVDASQR